MAYLEPTFTNGITTQSWKGEGSFISGFRMVFSSTTSLVIHPGAARAFSNSAIISYAGELSSLAPTLVIDTTSVGALGCYPLLPSVVAPSDDTSFGVYVLADSSQTNPVTAVVATGNNFLLPGYDLWRRIGTVHFDSGANTMKIMKINDVGSERHYQYLQSQPVLSAASSTGGAAINFSAGDLPCNPNFTTSLRLRAEFTPNTAASVVEFVSFNAPVSTSWPVQLKGQVDAVQFMDVFEIVPENEAGVTNLYYKNTHASDSLDLYLIGFTEDLGVQAV